MSGSYFFHPAKIYCDFVNEKFPKLKWIVLAQIPGHGSVTTCQTSLLSHHPARNKNKVFILKLVLYYVPNFCWWHLHSPSHLYSKCSRNFWFYPFLSNSCESHWVYFKIPLPSAFPFILTLIHVYQAFITSSLAIAT